MTPGQTYLPVTSFCTFTFYLGTYIMKVADEYIQLLDDQIVMTQQLSFSPYKDAFADRIEEWEEKLKLTTKVIEEWIELQK